MVSARRTRCGMADATVVEVASDYSEDAALEQGDR